MEELEGATSSMIADAIDRISELARQGEAVEIIEDRDNTFPRHALIRVGRELQWHDVPPPLPSPTLLGFPDFVAVCLDKNIASKPEVYHGDDELICVLERSDRRDVARMPFSFSKRFQKLCALAHEPKTMTVREAVKLLRFELHDTGVDHLISSLKRVDFSRSGTGHASVEHGKEGFGRQVEMSVQKIDDIPERFVVNTPIYMNRGLRSEITASVDVGIYVDVEHEKIEIGVLSDEIEEAWASAQMRLGELLREALVGIPVFGGRP